MVEFTFLQSRDGNSLDGGGAYTRNLIQALRDAGHGVLIRPYSEAAQGTVVIDGADLSAYSPAALHRAVGLVHHCAALPGAGQWQHLRRIVATSDATATRLTTEFGVSGERVTTITPGVHAASRSPGSAGPHCQILSIGALVLRKAHGVLIEALTKLYDLDWRLTVVGNAARDAATASALQAMADGSGGRVRLAGPLDDAALERLWLQADLFALATEWEGYAAPVAEALRRGVPVAVTAGGAAAALMSSQAGVICDVGDVVQLSKSLRRMIFDTGLRSAMAAAAWRAGQALPTWQQQAAHFAAATA